MAEYGSGGYGDPPPTKAVTLDVFVSQGQDTNWLHFRSGRDTSPCCINYHRRLVGQEVLEIVTAVAEDLRDYVAEMQKDQKLSEGVLLPAFGEMIKKVTTDTTEK